MPPDIEMSKKVNILLGRERSCQAVLLLYSVFSLPARLVPIRTLALWADLWFALRALAGYPCMAATQALVTLLCDDLEPHTGQIVYQKGIYHQGKYYLIYPLQLYTYLVIYLSSKQPGAYGT